MKEIEKFKSDRELLVHVTQLFKTQDPTNLICSECKSISKDNLDAMTDEELVEVFEDVYQFSCSFVDKSEQVLGSDPIKWSSIDFATYYKFLKRVNSILTQDQLLDKLRDMLEVFSLEQNASDNYMQTSLRGFILLLLIPEMEDFSFYGIFEKTVGLFKLCLVKARKPEASDKLKTFPREFLSELLPKDEFQRTVAKF